MAAKPASFMSSIMRTRNGDIVFPSSSKTGPSRLDADDSFTSDPQATPSPPTAKPFRSTYFTLDEIARNTLLILLTAIKADVRSEKTVFLMKNGIPTNTVIKEMKRIRVCAPVTGAQARLKERV